MNCKATVTATFNKETHKIDFTVFDYNSSVIHDGSNKQRVRFDRIEDERTEEDVNLPLPTEYSLQIPAKAGHSPRASSDFDSIDEEKF